MVWVMMMAHCLCTSVVCLCVSVCVCVLDCVGLWFRSVKRGK